MNKKLYGKIGSFLFLALFLSSTIAQSAFAQVSSTEGQTSWRGQDREQINQWREQNNKVRASMDKLDDEIVREIPLPILFGLTPDNLTRNFGDARSGGRAHEGLDIMAPKRALIVSPTDAVVLSTGTGASSGNYVYTANPGGETFAYMHLDEIADIDAGDFIPKGTLIGYVGNTGNASGGATHLHFEIRHEDGATDPYPRITRIFPLADKIEYLTNILEDSSVNKAAVEAYVVANYKVDLITARNMNIALPSSIVNDLKSVPVPPPVVSVPPTPVATSTSANLTVGSKGPAVVALQRFLISKGIGSAKRVVADESFGPITRQALADYQASVGITPAAGYYGPITRAYVAAHQ